jgi:hypothetical protein
VATPAGGHSATRNQSQPLEKASQQALQKHDSKQFNHTQTTVNNHNAWQNCPEYIFPVNSPNRNHPHLPSAGWGFS